MSLSNFKTAMSLLVRKIFQFKEVEKYTTYIDKDFNLMFSDN